MDIAHYDKQISLPACLPSSSPLAFVFALLRGKSFVVRAAATRGRKRMGPLTFQNVYESRCGIIFLNIL
jgi:hypothetical protein